MTSASGMSVFSHKTIVTSYFENSDGLKVGAPVNLEGVAIGEVKAVQITSDPARKLAPVKVVMKLDPKYHASLHTDSKASLSTVGVLGDTVLDINSKAAVGPELKSGAELQTLETPNLSDVVKAGEGTVESLNVILAKVNRIADTIESGTGTVGKLINDPALYNKATATVDQLQTLAQNLNRGKGTAGKLLKDDTLYNNLNSTLIHANSLLAEADAGKGALGLLVKDPAFAKKLDHTVTQLDTILTNVNGGKGTIGKLATDNTAYTNLNNLLTSSTDLVTTIRKDPKKYLTIHMKIF
jgi:phospholipid/cholesterol/gamma-HCH transport system substrate-binding protein